uniref:Uncharacterized protein n=1 Tax=Candidatus Kentrum sp. MB TaxID=2138164 RepID=A0A450XFX7_9GAMM|nr:MAG: hypothetical protein BECKMB1821G_GA0114241_103426 [Candidatus Kentron sp. MB]
MDGLSIISLDLKNLLQREKLIIKGLGISRKGMEVEARIPSNSEKDKTP